MNEQPEDDSHRDRLRIGFADDRHGVNRREGAQRRACSSTEQGLDLLADERTKEVLDKIGSTIDEHTLKIVVAGKTEVGKTTLINGLFEDNVQVHVARNAL